MGTPPEPRRSISRLLLVAIAIAVAVIALVAALVWRPLTTSLHLAPAPGPDRSVHPAAGITSVAGRTARAP